MTTPDLTPEWLDELEHDVAEAIADWGEEDPVQIGDAVMTRVALREMRTLIVMARAKQDAERERDALRETCDALMAVWLDVRAAVNGKPLTEIQAALAQPTDAGGA